jgi:hypothetical protein
VTPEWLHRKRRQPELCFAVNADEDAVALYFSDVNKLALTKNCDESNAFASLVHEYVHWAQTLGLTRREIRHEAVCYGLLLAVLGEEEWRKRSVIEKMADWVEENCLDKGDGT